MTQRALSQVVGFRSLAHLSDIESGKRYPARETLPKFAAALGVSVSELESRDVREPVEALKSLFAMRPEMIRVFLRLAELARGMDPDEIVRRVTGAAGGLAGPEVVKRSAVPVEAKAADVSVPQKVISRKPAVEHLKPEDQPSLF
jgi:transcriptional regulator with XRE-family HTH domain